MVSIQELEAIVKADKAKKTTREPRKKEETIQDFRWKQQEDIKRLRELEAQDETNFTETDKSVKGKEVNMRLVKNHISYYQQQLEKLQEPFNPMLNNWKRFITKFCEENNQPIEKIWFDTSAPYDCEISIRLAGHRCWNACVEFRFQDGNLRAFDSHFGGGTSMLDRISTALNPNAEQEKVEEVMKRVFAKECSDSGWEAKGDREGEKAHRLILIGKNGWRSEIDMEDYMSQNEKEDRADMIAEVNAKGFIQDGDKYIYWTHYGKKENDIQNFKQLLNKNFFGIVVDNTNQKVIYGENQNPQTNTWIVTKDFFEHLKERGVKNE